MTKLTTKQEKFCLALVKGMSLSDAYRKSYNVRSMKPETIHREAHEVSQNPNVAARLAELRDQAAERTVISREWVIERLVANAEKAAAEETVLDSDGKPTGEYRYQGTVVNRALELLGKELGMFVERVEQNTKHEFLVSDKPMSPDEFDQAFSVEPATRPTSSTH